MEFKLPKLPVETKPFLWGAVAGAAVLSYVGFSSMGWMLDSTAAKLAKKQTEDAVVTAMAPVCVAQFKGAPDSAGRLATLEKVQRWSRGDELVKAGFATMPGGKEPSQGVATACAELLLPEKAS